MTRSFALLLALLVGVGGAQARTPDPPMSEEEVVRRHVAGESQETLLREIERRQPQFDLSSEMLEELRRAGIPAAILEAMKRRQAQVDAATEGPTDGEPVTAPSQPKLTIELLRRGSRTLRIRRTVPPQLAAEWELGNAPEDRVFADVALYLACHTGHHVPDHWRNQSPLGVDFLSMRRHRMLVFVQGRASSESDEGQARSDSGGSIRLDLPETIEFALEPVEPHDLSLGLAVQIGGRYYRWTDDSWADFSIDESGRRVQVRIKGTSLQAFGVQFARDPARQEGEQERGLDGSN